MRSMAVEDCRYILYTMRNDHNGTITQVRRMLSGTAYLVSDIRLLPPELTKKNQFQVGRVVFRWERVNLRMTGTSALRFRQLPHPLGMHIRGTISLSRHLAHNPGAQPLTARVSSRMSEIITRAADT